MKKIYLMLFTTILIMTFIGCSAGADKVESKNNQVSYVKGETVMVSHKEVLTGEGWWRRTHYLDDTLYYGVSDAFGNYIYTINDHNATELKLESQDMLVTSYVPDAEGNSYFLSMENTEEERTYYLSKVDADGTEVYRREVPTFAEELFKGGCADAAISEQGYCVLNGYGTCFVWNLQGEEMVKLEDYWFPEKEMDDYSAGEYGLINGAEGIYVYHVAGNCIYLQLVDMENQQLREEITVELPITLNDTIKTVEGGYMPDISIKVYSSYEKGIYISDEEKLYAYNDSINELSEVISWSDPGISVKRDCIQEITVNDQGIPTFYGYDKDNEAGVFYYMTIKPIEEFVQKTIEIGYIAYWEPFFKNNLEKYIVDYNTSQSETTVVLKSYDDLTDLHLALIQSEGPDILNLQGLDIDEYIEKGILENMDPYFENSHTLKKEDILPSVQEMISKEGSVYYMFPYFFIEVMILENEYADSSSPTTDDFLTLISQEDENYLCNKTSMELMIYLMSLDLDQYVDWENKSCSFDDGRFALYMENLKKTKLPKERNLFSNLTYAEQIHEGKYAALMGQSVISILDYRDMMEAFGGFAKIIGCPNQEGKDIYPIQPSAGLIFGINCSSDHKDASWEFLDYYIRGVAKENEINRDVGRPFSILKDTFEIQLYPEAKPGTEYYRENVYIGGDFKEDFVVMEETRDELRDMVDKLVWSTGFVPSGKIGDIITEELMTFLDGDKSAEEVADIIQSRVSIYMEE